GGGTRPCGGRSGERSAGALGIELVTHGVAERLVDSLEVVEVEEQHAEKLAAAACRLDRAAQAIAEHPAAAEPGQAVVIGQEADLLLGAPALGHVLRRALQFQRAPVLARDQVGFAVDHGAGAAARRLFRLRVPRTTASRDPSARTGTASRRACSSA